MVNDSTKTNGDCMQCLMNQLHICGIKTFERTDENLYDPGFKQHSIKSKIKATVLALHDLGITEYNLEKITEYLNNYFGTKLTKDNINKWITGTSTTSKKDCILSKDLIDGDFLEYDINSTKYRLHPNASNHDNIDGVTEIQHKQIEFNKHLRKYIKIKHEEQEKECIENKLAEEESILQEERRETENEDNQTKKEKLYLKIIENKKRVDDWLEENGFPTYIEKLEKNEKIATDELDDLTNIEKEDLKEMGMPPNKIRKFMEKIAKLKDEMSCLNQNNL